MTTRTPEFAVSVDPGELHFNAAHFITFAGTSTGTIFIRAWTRGVTTPKTRLSWISCC